MGAGVMNIIPAAMDNTMQVIGGIKTYFMGRKQQRMANKIHPEDKAMGLLQQEFNGRMRGAAKFEQNNQTAQGATLDYINRNATDSTQALALAAGTQGQINNANEQLAGMENENHMALMDRMNAKYDQQYIMDVNAKAALTNAAMANKMTGGKGVGNGVAGMIGTGASAYQGLSNGGSARADATLTKNTTPMINPVMADKPAPSTIKPAPQMNYGTVGPQQPAYQTADYWQGFGVWQ